MYYSLMIDIFSYDGSLKRESLQNIGNAKDKMLWIDIQQISGKEANMLKSVFGLHPLTIEDLMHLNTRIKAEEFPDYLFCIFYGIKSETELREVDFVLGKNFLITNHKKEIGAYTELKSSSQKLEALFKKGIEFIFHKLLDMEIDNFIPVLENMDDHIESLEEKVVKKQTPQLLSRILKLKRDLIQVKKTALPQREKIGLLVRSEYKYISKKAIPYFRDIHDHAIRVSDLVENHREAITNTFDVYISAVSNNMNEVMKTLSIIATIALPLTVISGIFGTNFANLPGEDSYYGFWFMLLGMLLLSLGMIYYFRKKGWF
ncbi:magnesium/cobalt transporter CorA [Candidatus Woesearchaeota archaeon]|nr:magnesium/cobalt transporter CorA [Candidatus Woesearchaeota archaeon]